MQPGQLCHISKKYPDSAHEADSRFQQSLITLQVISQQVLPVLRLRLLLSLQRLGLPMLSHTL